MNKRHSAYVITVALMSIACLLGGAVTGRAQAPSEDVPTRVLPAAGAHWVYVLDPGYPSVMTSKIDVIDADALKMLGMISAGYISYFESSPSRPEVYSIDTYYSRGTRGTRTDVVTIYDSRKLEPIGEVEIPPKRILVVPKRFSTGVTPDGRFMLVANMTPATSVSVVDLPARKFVGEIDTPGCTQVLISAKRRFTSMCADGSLLSVDLDEAGQAAHRDQSNPFFDPEKDPVFDHPAIVGPRAYFATYHGMMYAADLSQTPIRFDKPWPLLTDRDKAELWRPGGWQMMAANPKDGRVYVLMHQGGEWSHKQPGTEVWVFDAARQRRVDRLVLAGPGYSIQVSSDADPLLYVATPNPASPKESTLQVYSALRGRYMGMMQELGSPFLLYRP
jgi:methylamine dehydrogenase heavy chain